VHVVPTAAVPCAHFPLTQLLLTQAALAVHAAPMSAVGGMHFNVVGEQLLLRQAELPLQYLSRATIPCMHLPLLQLLLSQCPLLLHTDPTAKPLHAVESEK
jgi:cell shape-determining protein MreD